MSTSSEDRRATHDQRNKRIRDPFPVPIREWISRPVGVLRVVLPLAACTAIGVAAASAQPEVIRCLRPEPPMTELPVEVLAEYRTEIAVEFEAYLSSVSEHIACLDDERARAMDEARAVTEANARLLNTIPARKDLP